MQYELLEPRHLLAAEIGLTQTGDSEQQNLSTAPVSWFETIAGVERMPLQSLTNVDRSLPEGVAGPVEPVVGQWIVQLSETSSGQLSSLAHADQLLSDVNNHFTVVRGLGAVGSLLVQARGASKFDIELSLAENPHVVQFDLNHMLQGQAIFPNDPDFSGLIGMHNVGQFGAVVDADVDAPEAWQLTQGSTSVVVGVIDSGIDVAHPDLYLNIWINQGEIPTTLRPELNDTDGDDLITLYDLNHASNSLYVRDLNGNGYIDAIDLLQDPAWADGRDTDGNGFIDDFFGWNFRTEANEPFAPNNPSDALGHGTHVAGTIGALGNNARGVTGLNWRSSLMSLKFLDENNQGDTAAAIAAINYANMMRSRFDTPVRVLNNSWGQPGGVNLALQNAIQASGESGILFVAASGNGNILGQGVDNDRTPFYPASFDSENVIAVGASDGSDRLAGFSNYGLQSVDIVAPGVGVRSTLPGGGYGEANGTSMATPHVTGVAALVWALQPEATVAEVRRAILENSDAIPSLGGQISTGRRLNAYKSLVADVFAPTAELLSADNVSVAGGTEKLITVKYRNRLGVDVASLGDSDLRVTRQAAVDETFNTTFISATENSDKTELTAIYSLAALGGSWDAEDYGIYVIDAKRDAARSLSGLASLETILGSFEVKIAAPGIFYVNSYSDSVDANPGDRIAADSIGRTTLRAAIQEANALAPVPVKIFLQSGTYPLSLTPVIDPLVVFPVPGPGSGYDAPPGLQWSGDSTGDLDLQGNITLVGLGVNRSIIDAQGIDRVLKLYAGATASISGLTLTGGNAPANHSGGAILTSGNLSLDLVTIRNNRAKTGPSSLGGGIAQWNGKLKIDRSLIKENNSIGGGGLFVTNASTANIDATSFVANASDGTDYLQKYQLGGGGILTGQAGRVEVTNSTFIDNRAEGAAIGSAVHNLMPQRHTGVNSVLDSPSISADGRYIAYGTSDGILPIDHRGSDIYVYDTFNDEYELVSVSTDGVKSNSYTSPPVLSADGRYVAFRSSARNLDEKDGNGFLQIFWRDRLLGITKMASISSGGIPANDSSLALDISEDGQHVLFRSYANNLVSDDFNGLEDAFIHHVQTGITERVSVSSEIVGSLGGGDLSTLSGDGRFVAFASQSNDLVENDINGGVDVFVRDLATDTTRLVSRSINGGTARGHNSIPGISADGNYISFISSALDIVDEATSGGPNIILHDVQLDTNFLVTRGHDGQPSDGHSDVPVMSPGGRYVAFVSSATNLVRDDTNGVEDLFVFDRQTQSIQRVPIGDHAFTRQLVGISDVGPTVVFSSPHLLTPGIAGANNAYQYDFATQTLSRIGYLPPLQDFNGNDKAGGYSTGSGRFVSFSAAVPGLVESDNNAIRDIFLRDQSMEYTELISVAWDGGLANAGSFDPKHSDDGRYVVFRSNARNLIPDDFNGRSDIFLRDRHAGTTERIIVSDESVIDPASLKFTISGDGSKVLFESVGSVFVAGDNNGVVDVFTYDIATKTILRVSKNLDGADANARSYNASISTDGRYITYGSDANNLVEADTNNSSDIFVYDSSVGSTERVSISSAGSESHQIGVDAGGASFRPAISANGRFIAFKSLASDLVPNDMNASEDIFVRDRLLNRTSRISVSTKESETNGSFGYPTISDDGRFVAFSTTVEMTTNETLPNGSMIAFRDQLQGTTETMVFSYPAPLTNTSYNSTSYRFDGNSSFFTSTARVPIWMDLTQDSIRAWERSDGIRANAPILNHTTIIDRSPDPKSLAEDLLYGDVVVLNSLVSKAPFVHGPTVVFGVERGMPLYVSTTFVDPSQYGEEKVSDHLVYFGVPYDTESTQRTSSFFRLEMDQLGSVRSIRQNLGAVELVGARIEGVVFVDSNGNGQLDEGELGLEGITVFVDYDGDSLHDQDEPFAVSGRDFLSTPRVNEAGGYAIEDVRPGRYPIVSILGDEQRPVLTRSQDQIPIKTLPESLDISDDGRFVVFSSAEFDLVAGDTNGTSDVFVFDSVTGSVEILSIGAFRSPANSGSYEPVISGNGRFVAFLSAASNLVEGDSNNEPDAFIVDRQTGVVSLLSVLPLEVASSGKALGSLAIAADGSKVAFVMQDIVTGATRLYVRDVVAATTTAVPIVDKPLVSDPSTGAEVMNASFDSAFSQFAFISSGSDLVVDDTNGFDDVFVYQFDTGKLIRASVNSNQQQSDGRSEQPFLSGDGTRVAFVSYANNMFDLDVGNGADVIVRNLVSNSTMRITVPVSRTYPAYRPNLSNDGSSLAVRTYSGLNDPYGTTSFQYIDVESNQPIEISREKLVPSGNTNKAIFPVISGDGTKVVYTELISSSTGVRKSFVWNSQLSSGVINRFLEASKSSIDLPVRLANGSIAGHVYNDTIRNDQFDPGEATISKVIVYLDANNNGLLDNSEARQVTGADGRYQFQNLIPLSEYFIGIIIPTELAQVFPANNSSWRTYISAGSHLEDRDFALTLSTTGGQFENASISGTLFRDLNEDGIQQVGEPAFSGVTVYLDLNGSGGRDFNEPRVVTDSQGAYTFTGLGNRVYTVRTLLDSETQQTSPLGASFATETYRLTSGSAQLANAQDVLVSDFNSDGHADLAVALYAGNSVSIRLNDGKGGFTETPIQVSVAPQGVGPIALATADLNGNSLLDLVTANQLNGTATVMLDFNGQTFASLSTVAVGDSPTDVALGDFDRDGDLDFVVVSQQSSQLAIFINNGLGVFSPGSMFSTGGQRPTSVVAGHFNNDAFLDLAITNFGTHPRGGDFGNVTVLRGRGDASFDAAIPYSVGIGPISIAADDLNDDGFDDLVSTNFLSNTASVLMGSSTGVFSVSSQPLSTGQGPLQVSTVDIDGDRDVDIVVTNLLSQSISILRNRQGQGGAGFEPADSFGVGQFQTSNRLAFALGDFDVSGVPDLAIINSLDDSLKVLSNRLVDGAHRVQLSGVETLNNLHFGLRSVTLPPSFALIPNPQPILEDAPLQMISISGITKGRETGPPLRFTATSLNGSLIASPTVTYSGGTNAKVRYAPQADMNGESIITVRAVDAGADGEFDTADDGIFERSFIVSVLAVNDAPLFEIPTAVVVTQKAGAQVQAGFVTGFGPSGGADEATQNLSPFTVMADASFFTTLPAIDAAGQLTFTPNPHKSGVVPVTVSVSDDGGRANGGNETTTKTFVVNLQPVNDPPSINLLGNQSVHADAGLQTVAAFASGFQPGGGEDESNQVISDFIVTVDSPGLFSVLPVISTTGTLTYAPAIDRTGMAMVSVQVRDSGGRANGGNDLSPVQTFTITVDPILDTIRPKPVITPRVPSQTNATSFEVEIDFREPVTGFRLDDITVSSGTKAAFTDKTGGIFTFQYTGNDGEVTFSITENVATDLAGNANFAALPVTRSIDATRSLPLLSGFVPELSNFSSFFVAINFEKQVVGFSLSSMFAVGGSLSEFTVVDDATGKYSVKVTPSADGVVTLLLPANAATDLVGNGNLAAAPLVRTIDRVAPVLTLSSTQSSPSLNTTFEVIVQSTKAITGLSAASFDVSGGSIGEPVPLGGQRYSVMAAATGGTFELSVKPGAVSDSAGNVNAISNVLQIDVTPRSPILAPKVNGEAIDLTSMSDTELLDVETIDLRGFGDNVLTLDSDKIRTLFGDASVTIYADPGDTIAFDGDWQFVGIELVDGAIHRIFTKAGATIFVNGPLDYTNPQNRFDVDGSGEVVALDGLLVLTTIRNKRLASANGSFLPMTTENLSQYRFVDVNRDNLVTPLDALLVLNEVRRQGREGSGGSGEQVVVVPMQNAPLIAMATSSSSTRTEDRDSTSAELVNIGDASQNPAKTISCGPQQWRVNTTRISDDEHGEQNDRVTLIDEAFADPLLLN